MAQQMSTQFHNARSADPVDPDGRTAVPALSPTTEHSEHPPPDDDCVNWGEEVLVLP
jgi:hypothetical protein